VKPLAITGVGVVSPIGTGMEAFSRGLGDHETLGLSAFRHESGVLDADNLPGSVVAEAWDFDPTEHLGKKGLRNFDRLTCFLLVGAKLALEEAGLKQDGEHRVYGGDRVGLCSATAYGSLEAINEIVRVAELEDPRFLNPNRFPNTVINSAAGYVSIREDLRAPNVTVVDGNCGALDAVLTAETHLLNRRADAFLVGGGEVLSEPLYLAFRKLQALAEGERFYRPGHPDSEGMRMGEGAAYLCMEDAEAAAARDANVLGRVVGYGNAFEPPESEAVLVHASERAVERAIQMALKDADLPADAIDVACSSVNGMRSFDAAELDAVTATLGERTAVAAPKTLFGETFGAGGALGLASAVAWLSGARVGPMVRGAAPERPAHVLTLAVGFYGNVSAVIVSR
jgi:3-oxoacyl-(acyl-carrier-protein) synthase